MSDNPKIDPKPTFSVDETQPASAVAEHQALSEREDGVNRGGREADPTPSRPGQADAYPTIVLAADEQQPVSADAEHKALSEREDGTNRG
ncbi:MAG TPA: hypothetical protein VL358_09590 [Caulobacteraceae bacterium]|jgi:hypothetical protein|nr:hypothetical protein [Caulobacteraceae bacterium]